jgi:hypothetical protein
MIELFTFDGEEVRKAESVAEWSAWAKEHDGPTASLRRSEVHTPGAEVIEVSTVFLGIRMVGGDGRSRFFETMVFGGTHDRMSWHWETAAAARAGHDDVLRLLRVIGEQPPSVPTPREGSDDSI